MLGLYLHIPWCVTRCVYCDFNTYIDGEDALKVRYHAALLREIAEAGDALGHPPLDTIFFGGGTPTTLPAAWLGELVEAAARAFALRPDAEITSEANPGTLDVAYLRALRAGGVNRLSLGVQSLRDEELRRLSRLHDAETARQAVRDARAAGFDNLSLDLIFNQPRQTLAEWQESLTGALALDPDHLSIYSLIVEPGTPLQRAVARGAVPEPDDDVAADMYEWTLDTLDANGYAHYEISNWARDGGEAPWESPRLASAHNLVYWRGQDYLGLGAGAWGTFGGERWANVKRPQRYIALVEGGAGIGPARDPRTVERIDDAEALRERMMLGLRLVREGVSEHEIAARFGLSLADHYADAIAAGQRRGLLEWIVSPADRHLRLTRAGRFLANAAVLPFFDGDDAGDAGETLHSA